MRGYVKGLFETPRALSPQDCRAVRIIVHWFEGALLQKARRIVGSVLMLPLCVCLCVCIPLTVGPRQLRLTPRKQLVRMCVSTTEVAFDMNSALSERCSVNDVLVDRRRLWL